MLKPNKDGYYNDGWVATGMPAFSEKLTLATYTSIYNVKGAVFTVKDCDYNIIKQVEAVQGHTLHIERRVLAIMSDSQLSSSAVVQCKELPADETADPAQWQLTCMFDYRYEDV